MLKSEIYPNLKVDEYWSIDKIYKLSKKYDDLEGDLFKHLLYVIYYAELMVKLKLRESKLKICKLFWKCIKVSLLLSQDLEDEFIIIVEGIKGVLIEGMTILNKEFRETQDSEVLNFPDPDKQEYIDKVRSLLSIKHKTESSR